MEIQFVALRVHALNRSMILRGDREKPHLFYIYILIDQPLGHYFIIL